MRSLIYNLWGVVSGASIILGVLSIFFNHSDLKDAYNDILERKRIKTKTIVKIVAIIFFILLSIYSCSIQPNYVYVPPVTDTTLDNAIQTLASNNLDWELSDGQVYNSTRVILSQDPSKEKLVKKGSKVKLSYDDSLNPKPVSPASCDHRISSSNVEDYSKNLNPEEYLEYTSPSEYKDFYFSYPPQLFNRVECSRDDFDTLLGKNIETHAFYGSLGTTLTFSLSSITDPLTDRIKRNKAYDSLYSQESAEITIDEKDILTKENGFEGFIVTGYDKNGMIIYKIVRISTNCVMEMRISCPPFANNADRLHKRYVHECLAKMCGFSNVKRGSARSYLDFLNAQ